MSEFKQYEHTGIEAKAVAMVPKFRRQVHETCVEGFGRLDFDPTDSAAHIRGDYLTTVRTEAGTLAGFLTGKFGTVEQMLPGVAVGDLEGQDVAYLFGTAVRQQYQHNGLYTRMVKSFLYETMARRLPFTLFATQNPSIEAGFAKVLEEMKQNGQIEGFERMPRIPIPGRYGMQLTGGVPSAVADNEVQQAYNTLDREAGDAFGVAYQLTYPAGGPGRRDYVPGVFGPSW